MKQYFALLLCISFFLAACSLGEEQKTLKKVIQVKDATLTEAPLSDFFKVNKVVCLDTAGRKFIKQIDKIEKHQNKYYVLSRFDNKEIYVFDIQGKFLYTLGHYGEGVGAYTQPYDFLIDEKTQEVEVLTPGQVLYYELATGVYKRSKTLNIPAVRFYKTSDNYAFVCGKGEPQLHLTTLDFVSIMGYLPYENVHGMLPFVSFIGNNDKLLYFRNFDDTVYEIKKNIVEEYVTIDFEKGDKLEQEDYQLVNSPDEVFRKLDKKSLPFNLFYENEKHYLFAHTYQGSVFLNIFDKKSGLTQQINIFKNKNDLTGEEAFPLIVGQQKEVLFAAKNLEGANEQDCVIGDFQIFEIELR